MDGQYYIISWFATLPIVIERGVVTPTIPTWADYLIGWSFTEIVEFCDLNDYTIIGTTDERRLLEMRR